MQLQGQLTVKKETQTIGDNGFRKREFVLKTDSQYPQEILLQLVQDKCELLDSFNVGDTINASININGRKWTNKEGVDLYFNSIQAWRLESVSNDTPELPVQPQTTSTNLTQVDDDLPF